jgi:hypothetical protein
MHPFPREYVDRSGKRRGHRGDEDRVAPVIEFLDDECGNQASSISANAGFHTL